jgi:hypothetical protein
MTGLRSGIVTPSAPHELREQVVAVESDDIPTAVRRSLEIVRTALRGRHTAVLVRLPHQEILPVVQHGILTVVTRDRRRLLPLARLFLHEAIEGISKVEIETRMESTDFGNVDPEAWQKIRQWCNARAWDAYKLKTKLEGRSSPSMQ